MIAHLHGGPLDGQDRQIVGTPHTNPTIEFLLPQSIEVLAEPMSPIAPAPPRAIYDLDRHARWTPHGADYRYQTTVPGAMT